MKNIKKMIAAVLMSTFVLSMAGCKMIQKTPEAIKKTTVAKIGDDKITLGEVDEKLSTIIEQIKAQYGDKYTENTEAMSVLEQQRKQALDSLVNDKVMLKKAEELKLVPTKEELDKEIDAKITEIKKMYETEEKFNEALKTANFTNDTLRSYLKDQIIIQKTTDNMFKDITVTDEDIEKYYNDNKAQYTTKPGANISHILVKTEEEAKKVKAEYDKGAKFEDLAAKYGTDGTKSTGGSLGFISYDTTQYDADFMKAAKDLKEGEVSGPVKTQFGYHLIKVDGIVKEEKTKELKDVKEEIKQTVETNKKNDIYTKTLDQWKKDLKVTTYEDKLK
jgi:foldase protein PrsA